MTMITINGISLDPVSHGPALAAADALSADSAASNYVLIQTAEPLTAARRAELAGLGAEILEYVPENTYVARYQSADRGPIRSLPYVTWVNVYLRGFKVPASLRPAPSSAGPGPAALPAAVAVAADASKDPVHVDVVLHKGVSADAVRGIVAAAAGLDPAHLKLGRNKVRMVVERRRLKDLAALDEVRHLEPYVAPRLANDVARGILRVDAAQVGHALTGDGQLVTVCDTGFDTGSTNDVHPAFTGRVLKLYPLGRPTADDPNGHGTHVAGSVLGDAMSSVLGVRVQGTAPKARLILQSVLDPEGHLGGLPVDLHDLFIAPYRDDGSRVHTNSWGAPVNGSYTPEASEVDDFVWTHRDQVICFAAGNAGRDGNANGVTDVRSLDSPGSAKNCITVGASENLRPHFPDPAGPLRYADFGFPAEPIRSDEVASDAEGMAAFSGRGPTRNDRFKPDVVAPGTAVLSSRSRRATSGGWADSADPLYFFEGGTSMATPLVAGCAAVVRQFLQARGVATPSAALVKAMLINGARPIRGQYHPSEVAAIPDTAQGFGRVDLAATVGPYGPGETVAFHDEGTRLDTGEEERRAHAVAGPGRLLKATLVWTDPAGEGLQNDLDLVVRSADGAERHGNMAADSSRFDRTNNVEQVLWSNVPPGAVEVVVRGFRVTSPQSYALVVRIV